MKFKTPCNIRVLNRAVIHDKLSDVVTVAPRTAGKTHTLLAKYLKGTHSETLRKKLV